MKKRWIFLWIWLAILALLVYLYFFQPSIFKHIFEYSGPGSPYVNTPAGTISP